MVVFFVVFLLLFFFGGGGGVKGLASRVLGYFTQDRDPGTSRKLHPAASDSFTAGHGCLHLLIIVSLDGICHSCCG